MKDVDGACRSPCAEQAAVRRLKSKAKHVWRFLVLYAQLRLLLRQDVLGTVRFRSVAAASATGVSADSQSATTNRVPYWAYDFASTAGSNMSSSKCRLTRQECSRGSACSRRRSKIDCTVALARPLWYVLRCVCAKESQNDAKDVCEDDVYARYQISQQGAARGYAQFGFLDTQYFRCVATPIRGITSSVQNFVHYANSRIIKTKNKN